MEKKQQTIQKAPKDPQKKKLLDNIDAYYQNLVKEVQQDNKKGMEKLLTFCASKAARWSSNNIICLQFQKPNIERPVTVSEVKALGRRIIEKTKLAFILVPVVVDVSTPKEEKETKPGLEETKKEDLTEEGKQEEKPEEKPEENPDRRIFFKSVPCVCDLATETSGPPLGSQKLELQTAEGLLKAIRQVANGMGIDVVEKMFAPDGSLGKAFVAKEWTKKSGKTKDVRGITAGSYLSKDEQIRVLFHELAHQLMHFEKKGDKFGSVEAITKEQKELQAEAVAYICARTYGIESEYSGAYLKNWGATPADLKSNFTKVCKCAKVILTEMNNALQASEKERLDQVEQKRQQSRAPEKKEAQEEPAKNVNALRAARLRAIQSEAEDVEEEIGQTV